MTQVEIRDKLWAYIVENFLYMRPNLKVDPDDSLLRKGVFDSLGVMEVIGFIEETFGIVVEQEEVTEAHFGTLNTIAQYVSTKLFGASSTGG
jgi:acyl carrier protein